MKFFYLAVVFMALVLPVQAQETCEMSLTLTPKEAGLVAFELDAPCAPSTGLWLYHDHYRLHLTTNGAGGVQGVLPALSSPVLVSAAFEDGTAVVAATEHGDMLSQERMLLVGTGPLEATTLSHSSAVIGDDTGWLRYWSGDAELRLPITTTSCAAAFDATLLVQRPADSLVRSAKLAIPAAGCVLQGKVLALPLRADLLR